MPAPKALIISDFPILTHAMARVFRERYDVVAKNWPAVEQFVSCDAELIILDITVVGPEIGQQFLTHIAPGTRAAVCSLHRNEVDVYWIGENGPTDEGEFPSLLSLPVPRSAPPPSLRAEQA